jgi:hypothetical protein
MAIKIDIPGVGEVSIEGAAQESTMQEILAALNKSNKTKQNNDTAANRKLDEERKKEASKTKELNSELDELIDTVEDTSEETEKFKKNLGDAGKLVGGNLVGFAKSLAGTAATVATSFAKSYDSMSDNMVDVGAKLINTSIDITMDLAARASDVITGLAGTALAWIPFLGESAKAGAEATNKVAKGTIKVAGEIAKAGNDIMAHEFEVRIKALKQFSAAGVSFAGGMTQMGEIANRSGLGIAEFAEVVSKSRQSMVGMGMTATDASETLSDGLNGLATVTGKSGRTLRNELLAMGVAYEEQGEILAQYAANRASEGRLQGMTQAQLSKGTAEYAQNLKVISDLTGKDAKQLMEKARNESLRSSLLASLSGDQLEAFKSAYAQLEALGPEYQAALVQKLAGGAVAIPEVAANKAAMSIIDSVSGAVKSGSKAITVETQQYIAEGANMARNMRKEYGRGVDIAAVYGVQSLDKFAAVNNALERYLLDPDAAKRSMKSAEAQREATDAVTGNYVDTTEALKKFQIEMQTMATQLLPEYSEAIKKTTTSTLKFLDLAMKVASGKMSLSDLQKAIGGEGESTTKPTGGYDGKGGGVNPNAGGVGGGFDQTYFVKDPGETDTAYAKRMTDYANAQNAMAVPQKGKALGGISSGPISGYSEILHGTEAVVPLPDGKTIPVSLDSSSLTSAMNQQTGLLNQILTAMTKNNTLTSGILQNSY